MSNEETMKRISNTNLDILKKRYTWIISGDFNDSYGIFFAQGLALPDLNITFTFSKNIVKSCCPNTNSTEIDVLEQVPEHLKLSNKTETDKVKQAAERNPFNKPIDALKESKLSSNLYFSKLKKVFSFS